MAEVLKTTFLLRRGYKTAWEKNNPILAAGEPGFSLDENILKIGDGVKTWEELQAIGGNSVYNGKTHYDFPSIGSVNVIYKAEEEKKIYQWNEEKKCYELLCEMQTNLDNITLIHGGNANGRYNP